MILYIDTSAFVPLLISEPSTMLCAELWDSADRVVSTRLAFVEASAALAAAERMDRVSKREHVAAKDALRALWSQLEVVELEFRLMAIAAELAMKHGLRGYDAVHCGAALLLDDDDVVAAAGDLQLLAAWRDERLSIVNTNC